MTEPPDHLRCRCALVGESSNAAGSDEEINIEKLQAMLEVVRNSNPDGTWKRGTKKHMRLIQKDDHDTE